MQIAIVPEEEAAGASAVTADWSGDRSQSSHGFEMSVTTLRDHDKTLLS